MMMRGLRAFLLCAGMLAAWAIPAHAQAIGSIFGKVTDQSGGILPGVTVTLTNQATNISRETLDSIVSVVLHQRAERPPVGPGAKRLQQPR